MTASTRRAALGAILAAPLASVPAVAASERADYRARLLAAFAEDRACRPIYSNSAWRSIEERASTLVVTRVSSICREILSLPPPQTLDGLGLNALATALLWEGEEAHDAQEVGAIALIRATLAITGTQMPPGWIGFADEPDCLARDRALCCGFGGSLPAWALAEAEAARCA